MSRAEMIALKKEILGEGLDGLELGFDAAEAEKAGDSRGRMGKSGGGGGASGGKAYGLGGKGLDFVQAIPKFLLNMGVKPTPAGSMYSTQNSLAGEVDINSKYASAMHSAADLEDDPLEGAQVVELSEVEQRKARLAARGPGGRGDSTQETNVPTSASALFAKALGVVPQTQGEGGPTTRASTDDADEDESSGVHFIKPQSSKSKGSTIASTAGSGKKKISAAEARALLMSEGSDDEDTGKSKASTSSTTTKVTSKTATTSGGTTTATTTVKTQKKLLSFDEE